MDRNFEHIHQTESIQPSPSSQRAWIEIMDIKKLAELLGVALLAEGVDRNNNSPMNGRKSKESPSSQRAWIEIIRLRS